MCRNGACAGEGNHRRLTGRLSPYLQAQLRGTRESFAQAVNHRTNKCIKLLSRNGGHMHRKKWGPDNENSGPLLSSCRIIRHVKRPAGARTEGSYCIH